MGCDIHLYVEVRENGHWNSVHEWVEEDGWFHTDDRRFDPGRNYRLFAMLADVRNGVGFAGIDMGDHLNPIDDLRGLPDDASPETQQCANSWSSDGHSHSYFMVRELLDYDWTQVVVNRGVVDAVTFWQWTRGKEYSHRSQGEAPESWSGDVHGGTVQKVSEAQMDQLIADALATLEPKASWKQQEEAIAEKLPSVYCYASWTQPYYKMASYFLSHIMPQLWHLGDPDDVRIVFWFDN